MFYISSADASVLFNEKIYISVNIIAHLIVLKWRSQVYFGAKMHFLPIMYILDSDVRFRHLAKVSASDAIARSSLPMREKE